MNILQKSIPLTVDTLTQQLLLWERFFPLRDVILVVSVELKFKARELSGPEDKLRWAVNHFIGYDVWFLTDTILEDGPNQKELDYRKMH